LFLFLQEVSVQARTVKIACLRKGERWTSGFFRHIPQYDYVLVSCSLFFRHISLRASSPFSIVAQPAVRPCLMRVLCYGLLLHAYKASHMRTLVKAMSLPQFFFIFVWFLLRKWMA
jgi:hypothetical protein